MTHTRHRPGCEAPVPPRMFMCAEDSAQLPRPLQGAIWAAYRPGPEITTDPSPAHLAAARHAIEYLGERHQPPVPAPEPGSGFVSLAEVGPQEPAHEAANARAARSRPDNPCPGCGTAELTHGRETCQACGVLRSLQPSPERGWPDLSHGQPGHMCVLPCRAEAAAEAGA
jgi:hypothetical protein